jgi:hypothetical protein
MQYSLHISEPCSENWQEMTPTEMGRSCLHCQKEVIDFTEMTDNEVANYLHLHRNERVCGRVLPAQMKKDYVYIQPKMAESPVKRYIMALLAGLMVTTYMACQTPKSHYAVAHISEKGYYVENTSEKNVISGRFLDKETGKPIKNLVVNIHFWISLEDLDVKYNRLKDVDKTEIDSKYFEDKKRLKEENEMDILKMKREIFSNGLRGIKVEEEGYKTDENGYFSIPLKDTMVEAHLMLLAIHIDTNKDKSDIFKERAEYLTVQYKGGKHYEEFNFDMNQQQIEVGAEKRINEIKGMVSNPMRPSDLYIH